MKKVRQNENARRRGRPWPNGKPFPEQVDLRLAPGTLEAIERVLEPGQPRNDFIRKAIDKALTD